MDVAEVSKRSRPGAASRLGRAGAATMAGVGASSAAVLILEVVLTPLFAVAQFDYFAFLAVSLALLGFGASGSALHAFPRSERAAPVAGRCWPPCRR